MRERGEVIESISTISLATAEISLAEWFISGNH